VLSVFSSSQHVPTCCVSLNTLELLGRAVIDWPLCIDTSIMPVSTIQQYIGRTKEDKGTYSVIVKQNFYYLSSNTHTLCM